MIGKEYLATEYTFYRFPNTHAILMVPLLPSIIVIVLQSNLYQLSGGVFATIDHISIEMLLSFLFYFKLILSVVTSFFLVYRWSQIRHDGSYGYWITQGVDIQRFIIGVALSYTLLVSASEISGLFVLMLYLGLQYSFLQIIGLVIGVIFSNLLFSIIALLIAEIVVRAEIAGLVYIGLTIVNYVINVNQSSLLYGLFQLESSFSSSRYLFYIVFELPLIAALGGLLVYIQRLKDITL